MKQTKIPAVFMRGGTSKAVVFHARDLPAGREAQDRLFLAAMGSPDIYGRQLNGMGGGLSSLSKVCVVGPSSHPDADIDYTVAQVQIKEGRVDYHANCGNMSAAMGPFAVDEGLMPVPGGETVVRIHNTNTRKIIHARFRVEGGMAEVGGALEIPGVAGSGSPVSLEFREPGGATTGRLLPTGNAQDVLDVPGVGPVLVSMVDAANACVFIRASDLGLKGTEMPDEIEKMPGLMERLSAIRVAASLVMGIAKTVDEARKNSVPIVGFVSPAQDAALLSGEALAAGAIDVTARMLSNGQAHRAMPLTSSLCLSVAAHIKGSVVNAALAKDGGARAQLRIGMPSGILTASAGVVQKNGAWHAEYGALLRTQRRLFDGHVYVCAEDLQAELIV